MIWEISLWWRILNLSTFEEDGDDEGEDDPSEAEDGVEVEGGQEEVDGGVEEVGGGENENEDFSSGSSEEV